MIPNNIEIKKQNFDAMNRFFHGHADNNLSTFREFFFYISYEIRNSNLEET